MNDIKGKYAEMIKGVAYLKNEAHDKRIELDLLKNNIKDLKTEYNKEIKDYQTLSEKIISNESELEKYQMKTSKLIYKQKAILSNLNQKFYSNLYDASILTCNNEALNLIFTFCSFNQPMSSKDRIQLLKNEGEIIELLSYAAHFHMNLYKESKEDYDLFQQNIKNYYTKNKCSLGYPFDMLFEYISLVYETINQDDEKARLHLEFDMIVNEKNLKFLNLKALEGKILKIDSLFKTIVKYIKGINALLEKFEEDNKTMKYNNNNNSNDMKDMNNYISAIKQFKTFDFSTCKYDNMNSLSIQSEYSETNSIDASSLISKLKLNENSKGLPLNKAPTALLNNNNSNSNIINYSNCNNTKGIAKIESYPIRHLSSNRNKLLYPSTDLIEPRSKSIDKRKDSDFITEKNKENNNNNKPQIKKTNSFNNFKKIKIVKHKDDKDNRKNNHEANILDTSHDFNDEIILDNRIINSNNHSNLIVNLHNISHNPKDSICDEKITSTLNPRRVRTGNYGNNNIYYPIRKKNPFMMKFEHLENDHKITGCCESCT